jgi:hypothetical protein
MVGYQLLYYSFQRYKKMKYVEHFLLHTKTAPEPLVRGQFFLWIFTYYKASFEFSIFEVAYVFICEIII